MSIQVKDGSGNLQTVQTLPAAGQAVSANSLPVVLASDQSAVPVSLSGSVATAPPSHASTNVDEIGGAAIALGQTTRSASLPVAIASDQGAFQVNAYGSTTSRISYSGEITSATTTSALAAVAGEYLYVTDIDLFNAGASAVLVQLVNSAATVLWQASVPAGGGLVKEFATPVGGNGQMSADTALSLVTGSGTTALYANLNGYKADVMTTVLHNGERYLVNAHWHEANTAPWPHLAERSRAELRKIQDDLLLKSNDPATPLTKDELAYLKAANNHFDVRTALNLLKGRDHRDFGFEGVDQVHMNSIGYTCGCKLLIVFDHHKAVAGEIDRVHPHPPLVVCDDHAQHQHDLDLLHACVADDSLAGA